MRVHAQPPTTRSCVLSRLPRRRVEPAAPRSRPCTRAAAATGEPTIAQGWPPPPLYDLAIGGGRDFAGETLFMADCCAKYGGGGAARTFLELACGPGRHTRAAASAGLVSVGVDLSAEMVAYARTESEAERRAQSVAPSVAPVFQLGDMSDLFNPEAAPLEAGSFDVIACLYGSLSHMTDIGMAVVFFADAARLLSERGVLVVELDHPRDLFNGTTAHAARADAAGGEDDWLLPMWSVDVPGGGTLQVQWGAPGDPFDAIRQTLQRTIVVTTQSPGLADVVHCSSVPVRLFTCAELALLGARAGLTVAAVYGGLDGSDGEAEDADRLVVVFVADEAAAGAA